MSDNRLNLAVIIGSTREGRFGPTVARWFASEVEQRSDMDVAVIDLADAELPDVIHAEPTPAVQQFTSQIDDADAFVLVTPEYNHGYPASLKAAIDYGAGEWHTKPVGFVSYGGISGGLRAVEQLRQVFPELHALTVRDSVSFAMVWSQFGESGELREPRWQVSAANKMLDQLAWWAKALRDARNQHPYPG